MTFVGLDWLYFDQAYWFKLLYHYYCKWNLFVKTIYKFEQIIPLLPIGSYMSHFTENWRLWDYIDYNLISRFAANYYIIIILQKSHLGKFYMKISKLFPYCRLGHICPRNWNYNKKKPIINSNPLFFLCVKDIQLVIC